MTDTNAPAALATATAAAYGAAGSVAPRIVTRPTGTSTSNVITNGAGQRAGTAFVEVAPAAGTALTPRTVPTNTNGKYAAADLATAIVVARTTPRGLILPGAAQSSNSYAFSVDSANISVTGDIDLRAKVTLANWVPGTDTDFVSKWQVAGNRRSYDFYVAADGTLQFRWSPDGTTIPDTPGSVSGTGLGANVTKVVRITFDADDGAAHALTSFWLGDDINGPFTQLGSTVQTAGASSIHDNISALNIGNRDFALGGAGGIYHRVQIRNNIANDGTGIVFDINFEIAQPFNPPSLAVFNDAAKNLAISLGTTTLKIAEIGAIGAISASAQLASASGVANRAFVNAALAEVAGAAGTAYDSIRGFPAGAASSTGAAPTAGPLVAVAAGLATAAGTALVGGGRGSTTPEVASAIAAALPTQKSATPGVASATATANQPGRGTTAGLASATAAANPTTESVKPTSAVASAAAIANNPVGVNGAYSHPPAVPSAAATAYAPGQAVGQPAALASATGIAYDKGRTYAAEVLVDSPARYYRLNGDGTDSSGHGAPPVSPQYGDGPDYVASLVPNESSNLAARWITAPNNDAQLNTVGAAEFVNQVFSIWTLEGFVRWDEFMPGGTIFFGFSGLSVVAGSDDGELHGTVNRQAFGESWNTASLYLALGTLYHVAWTFDGVTSTIYLNGVPVLTEAKVGSAEVIDGYFTIGGSGSFGAGILALDEVAYYANVLSPARVTGHYLASLPPGTVLAEVATATGTAAAPAHGVPAGLATATGTANNAAKTAIPTAATGTGTANAPTPKVAASAALASATGAAFQPSRGTTPAAATATGTANAAGKAIAQSAALATAPGTAYPATGVLGAFTGVAVASATGTAYSPGATVVAPIGTATATATAYNATKFVTPGVAAATGTAQVASLSVWPNAEVAAALATSVGILFVGAEAHASVATATATLSNAAIAAASRPTISVVSPTTGTPLGGDAITINGAFFTGATAVRFGTVDAEFVVNSSTQITATSPPHRPGLAAVRVTTPGGTSL